LARQLGLAGHVVDLVSWSAQYPGFLYPGEQRVPEHKPEVPPWPRTTYPLAWYRPDGWWRVGRDLRWHDLVVLVLVTPLQAPAYLAILAALGSHGPRTLLLCHNVLPHERRFVDPSLVRALLRRTDAALVHSGAQASLAHQLDAALVAVAELPSGFPTPVGETVAPSAEVHRRLLFFGLVRPYKGLDVLVRALAEVPDVRLTVAGEFWGGTAEIEGLVD